MPCLILTGYPSSGKSTLASLFRERALLLLQTQKQKHNTAKKIEHVVIVTEATACPDQTTRECYNDSQAEKATRSALKAAFDRAVGAAAAAEISSTPTSSGSTDDSSKTLIILDSMNYIKGFRYELYCISKAAKERHAVVWVMNDVAVSKQWNENRRQQQQQQQQQEAGTPLPTKTNADHGGFYTNEQMEELILRYEPPDARNRWDKPLYRVDMRPSSCTTTLPGGGSSNQQQQQGLAKETLERSVYNMHDLSDAIHLQQETTIHAAPNKKAATTSMGGFKRASSTKVVRSSQNNNNTNTPATTPAALPVESMEKEKLGEKTTQTLGETSSSSLSSSSSSRLLLSLEERVDAILDSFLNHVQPLQQSFSTQEQLASSDANVLQKVDMLTQQICQAIVTAQNKHVLGGKLAIHLVPHQQHQQQQQQQHEEEEEGERLWLNYHRDVPLSWPELQRLRKQYMQWVKSQPPRDTSQRGMSQSFLQYIEASAHE